MDLAFSDEERELREAARRFARKEIAPVADRMDREDWFPREVFRRLGEHGFLGLTLPTAWGGLGLTYVAQALVLEEIARVSPALALSVGAHSNLFADNLARNGTDDQRQRFLPAAACGEQIGALALTEPNAGSDPAHLRTRYSRGENGYSLRGTKTFISNAVSAGVVLVFATSDPALGHRGISAFIVPPRTHGFSVAQRFDKLGLRGSETTELVLDDVSLPEDSLLGPEGGGLRIALGALTGGRVGIASCALGVAQSAFEELRRSVREDDTEWKRGVLARSYVELEAARALVAQAADLKDRGEPFVDAASVAKLVASRAAVAIASAGVDVAGPASARSGAVAERLLRDARVFPIVEGTTEIQELILARRLLDPNATSNL